jgi:hypothetical protein
VQLVEHGGSRALLLEPMLRKKSLAGLIAVFRKTVHAFSDKQLRRLMVALPAYRQLRSQRSAGLADRRIGSMQILILCGSFATEDLDFPMFCQTSSVTSTEL